MVLSSRIPMAYLALVGAMACPMVTAGAREHARLKAAAFALETSFVLGDLKIEGNVHDRDGARDRVLKAWKDRKYDDAKALADAVAAGVRADFQERGYFMVSVHEPASQPLGGAGDKQRMIIVVSVTEGEQFRVGTLSIQNAVSGDLTIPAATLREQFHLRKEGLFSVAEVRAGLERSHELYVARGYTEVIAEPETKIDSESHHINLVIRITEGPHKP